MVKYGCTLKRFNACVNGPYFDLNLAALRSKIASAFKFSEDIEFVLTYTDDDGDVVLLDDDNDLYDAAIRQKLNPLRINVELESSRAEAPQTKHQASNYRSPMSTALEDQLAQGKLAIDEALKFVPEQVPIVLAKQCHDLRSEASTSAPSLAEMLDRLSKLIAPKSNMQPSNGSAYCSSGSSSGHSYESFGPNGMKNGGFNSIFPPPPPFPHYPLQSLRADRNIHGYYPLRTYGYSQSMLDKLPSVSPYEPYSEGICSIGSPYRDLSDKHKSMPQHTLHIWIQCDSCGVTPITGSRYKSNIKDDYDLCSACFSRMVFEPVQFPITDGLTSSAGAEMASMPSGVPAPEAVPLPKPAIVLPSLPAPAPVTVTTAIAPVSVPSVPAAISVPTATSAAASCLLRLRLAQSSQPWRTNC
ncbi:hypothetical protein GUJ93_ZPchr0004g40273 [Zizania palustris]|uniref:ZZ-type domain-containing protein n=1 Tax=Zizania palustris TaxID=103762 RepID=A0A8J5VFH0_ZIZPA|nr:hypothetical protein GUJ93_ZPchr0004g40273 [Zizania palustris]KAG8064770.1 hypothetical protein GUJ93_ZPchr0004g40273 [Zizania palustris]